MTYLFVAYAVIWILLFGYVMYLSDKQKKLDAELDALKRQMDERS